MRELVRRFTWRHGILHTREIPPSKDAPRIQGSGRNTGCTLTIKNRCAPWFPIAFWPSIGGEREGVLRVSLQVPDQILEKLTAQVVTSSDPEIAEFLQQACIDGYQRLLAPSIEREIRNQLTESAEAQAISVFPLNLRNLLLQPPVTDTVVLGIDPAFRTGCKLAVVDGTGNLLETGTIYPHEPQHQVEAALAVLSPLVEKYQVQLIAIGNGTASPGDGGLGGPSDPVGTQRAQLHHRQ